MESDAQEVTRPLSAKAPAQATLDEQAAELITAEDAAASEASSDLRDRLAQLTAWALAASIVLGDDEDHRALGRRLALKLSALPLSTRTALLSHFRTAYITGIGHGRDHLSTVKFRLTVPALPPDVRAAAADADRKARERLRAAGLVLTGARNRADVVAGLALAQKAPQGIEATARWGVNRAQSAGVATVAEVMDESLLWVGERDACVHCLAYFGQVAKAGFPFPGGLTFGAKPLSVDPVPSPPLHPNCRCRIIVWRPEWGEMYPAALKREARRSIARGFSLPSESEGVRLRAADRLLNRGAQLPESVKAYARQAVKKGKFPRGRNFPGGTVTPIR